MNQILKYFFAFFKFIELQILKKCFLQHHQYKVPPGLCPGGAVKKTRCKKKNGQSPGGMERTIHFLCRKSEEHIQNVLSF